MRTKTIFMTLFTLSLGIVSTTFVLLAVTSKRWAVLRIFVGASDWTWANPICIINSSPFYHCGYPNLTFDATSNKSTCNVPNCRFYRAHGWDSTSCRLPRETGQSVNDLNANAQVCQQVHYSGNLQIAASVFITFGLLLLLSLTLSNIYLALTSGTISNQTTTEPTTTTSTTKPEPHQSTPEHNSHHSHHHRGHSRLSSITPSITFLTLLSLFLGAILQILAQFFGILGLVLNGNPASTDILNNSNNDFGADTWTMDTALSAYATVAWVSALACAGGVGAVYRGPRLRKLI